ERFRDAVECDFDGEAEMLHVLRYEAPKVGNDDDRADEFAVRLTACFADALKGRRNSRGGVFRAGTGSAMFYLWKADEIGASPDGRRKGEPFAANYSVSLFADVAGPFSVIRSLTKPELRRVVNGGPLTLEFASSMFSDPEGVEKVASLVKAFVDLGGHQLQLNAVNADKLKDAQRDPESHQQLIVRIWGWSAYFVELDRRFQDHVIARQEYTL
ncbi:MAG: pyruvate formate-lyase, partial [Clostridia bacterium]|nr:pyruvate formate-lyase [Clostridia bacterium]